MTKYTVEIKKFIACAMLASKDLSRYDITGVFIDVAYGCLVATDGILIIKAEHSVGCDKNASSVTIEVNAQIISHLKRALSDIKNQNRQFLSEHSECIDIEVTGKKVDIITPIIKIQTNVVDNKFPNYMKIFTQKEPDKKDDKTPLFKLKLLSQIFNAFKIFDCFEVCVKSDGITEPVKVISRDKAVTALLMPLRQ